ncbi:MAG: methyltransferase family protein [Myxococcales bacterium]
METSAAAPAGTQVRIGRWLFRWRGLTPVPVVAFLLALEADSLRHPTAELFPPKLRFGFGLLLCLLGQAARAWIRGVVPDGTSGATRVLSADSLNTEGAYRFTRNPLYLGNLLLCAGLLVQIDRPLAWFVGLGFFFGEYHFIIRGEEDFLLSRFGERYRQLLSEVPRFWPRLRPAPGGGERQRFDAARALRSEHNVAAAWLSGLMAVSALQAWARAPTLAAVFPWLAALAVLGLAYLAVKGWKRGWWLRSGISTARRVSDRLPPS